MCRVDTDYCTGPLTAPVSNNKLGGLVYSNSATNPPTTVNIKDWITGIGSGTGLGTPPVDALSNFDRSIDASIGGLATKMEKMYNSQRSTPLFEFRNLDTIQTSGVEQFMTNVDSAIQALHGQFANAPTKRKRQTPASCIRPFAAAATSSVFTASSATSFPTGVTSTSPAASSPIVVAPVDPPSQPSCVPTPTSSVKDSHESELEKAAAFFCSQYADSTVQNGPINIADTIIAGDKTEGREVVDIAYVYPPSMGNQDDVYNIAVTSVPNCTPNGGYNLATPVANNQCADILHSAWKQCKHFVFPSFVLSYDSLMGPGNNQGRGGAITAGCLVYSIATKY